MKTISSLHSAPWEFFDPTSRRWLSAGVPGCIHTDLRRHELIPDPFWGSNELELQWIEERNWKYRCEFRVDDELLAHEHLDLVAEGLDTFATLRLNGREIGRTDNMFQAHRFAVKDLVRTGGNLLEIEFGSPMTEIRRRMTPDHLPEWNDPVGGCSTVRKEQCSFGWDWGPRFATCGVYRPIRLEGWTAARFDYVRIRQVHRDGVVDLDLTAALAGRAEVRGTVLMDGETVAEFEADGGRPALRKLRTRIRKPRLWWPNGHGDQPLYTVKLELVRDGRVIDTWSERIGLRTVVLDRHKDEFGESFQFVVNGRPIFAKGANWIPAHAFVTEADRAMYDDLLTSAVEAHMNMIRVWGGGIYEMEDFYDLCDEKGLLVWQDFMFACALYPGDKAFLRSVKAEAEHWVKRLANRACLALWCGNNEIEQMPAEILKTRRRRKAYEDVFYRVLPEAVAAYDGVTAYWPSSPHNPEGFDKGHNNENAGDSHFWDVWHARFPVKRYEEKNFRFCSEFGMQSYSSPEVAATFCRPEDFNVFGPAMENHQKNPAGNLIILDYVSRLYRFPKDYASLAYLSQLNQAYCMKVGIEHFRRSMPRTMGALYWQLNDCWPVFSWSSLEFGGKWKALHYAAKRFFAPLLLSAHVPGDEKAGIGNMVKSTIGVVHLHTVYDGRKKTSGVIRWSLVHIDGRVLRKGEKRVTVRPGEARRQLTLDFTRDMREHGARRIYLRISLETEDGQCSRDTVFLTAPKFIDLPKDPISVKVTAISGTEFDFTFRSSAFHHQVQFELEGVPHRAEENFFELYPDEPYTIRVRTARPTTAAKLQKLVVTRSLSGTY
jgi:beta-mannosidase